MKLVANENIPLASVRLLREAGHEVVSISEHSPGMSDKEVLRFAHANQSVLITFDADYGELIYAAQAPCPSGILFLRIPPGPAEEPGKLIAKLLKHLGSEVLGYFISIDSESLRRKPLPNNVKVVKTS